MTEEIEQMARKRSNSNSNSEQQVLSYKPLKIGAGHFFYSRGRSEGVEKVLKANREGLKVYYPNLEFGYVAGNFDHPLKGNDQRPIDLAPKPFDPEIFHLDLNADSRMAKDYIENLEKQLTEVTQDFDAMFWENLNRGKYWQFAKGVRNFLNNYDKNVISRNHDWIINYGGEIKGFFNGFEKPPFDLFPKNSGVTQVALTSNIKHKLEEYYEGDVFILKNSVICDNYAPNDPVKDKSLEELFLEKGIMKEGYDHIAYAVRADKRKNVEEALLLTKFYEYTTGKKARLIVTLVPPAEKLTKQEKEYLDEISEFSKTHNISFSMGEASKFLDEENFDVGNFYHNCDLAVSTATFGGFEYANAESQVAEIPLIGRRVRELHEDFENNGMIFGNALYDNSTLRADKNYKDRLKHFNNILSDSKLLREVGKRLNLESMLETAKKNVSHNSPVVRDVYGHDVIAKDIIRLFELPGYENLSE